MDMTGFALWWSKTQDVSNHGLSTRIFNNSKLCLPDLNFRCGVYPGLYTEVSRYSDWIERSLAVLENEIAK